jgi:pimeloyl-ACP methyl ester carboxylesterase
MLPSSVGATENVRRLDAERHRQGRAARARPSSTLNFTGRRITNPDVRHTPPMIPRAEQWKESNASSLALRSDPVYCPAMRRIDLAPTCYLSAVALLGVAVSAFAQGITHRLPTDTIDRSPHHERFIAVNGARLQVLDWGGRGPLLMFLPGFGSGAHIFDDVAPAFTDRSHVVALTPRGFPPSSAPDSGYTVSQLAADVRGVLDSLGARQAILAAHSISGAVITRFAALYPDRLRAAIYLDAAFDFGPTYRMSHARPFGPPDSTNTGDAVRAWRTRYAVDSSVWEVDHRMWDIDTIDAKRRLALVGLLVTEVRSRPHEVLRVHAPALAICSSGSMDRVYGWLTPDSARWRAAEIYIDSVAHPSQRAVCESFQHRQPDGRGLVLDSGHFVFIDRRDEVVKIMRAFLDSLS